MKNRFLKALVAGFSLAFSAIANAGLIEVDFSDYSNGTQLSSIDGIDFSLIGGLESGTPAIYSGLLVNSIDSSYPTAAILQFNFDTLVNDISFVFQNWGDGQSYFSAYGLDDILLQSGSLQGANLTTFNLTASNVSYIQFNNGYGTSRSWIMGVESFSATTAEVPEPSTLAIFALGLMGLASRKFKIHA